MSNDNPMNLDPITNAPGAHPVGTGIGAAAGGAAAGAAAGMVAGPAGALVGAVTGAVVGGLGGKAVAESVNPTMEDAYWAAQYNREPYYEAGRTYDDYGPAYRLGTSGRTQWPGTFEAAENNLSTQWEARKERSTLSWPQARAASHAAWQRSPNQTGDYGMSATPSIPAQTHAPLGMGTTEGDVVSNDKVLDTLNDLIESCHDGEYGFKECAEHMKSVELKSLMVRHADECRVAGNELQAMVIQLGGTPDTGGTVSGALHRGWVSVRGALGAHSDESMLDECERGEDYAIARYRKALKVHLPAPVRALVERQAQGAQRNHDQVKRLRDTLKAAKA